MTQFVIHVGPHKTGSTYLQEAFALMRPQLAERGIHYPSVWGDQAHHKLYDDLRTIPNAALEAQFAELHAGGHATVLISGEGLSVLPPASVAYLRRLVGPDTPARIVFYARAWAGLLPSQWKQAVKGGATQTLPEFLFRRLVNPADSPFVNFGVVLRILAAAFGKDALRIVAYDQVTAAKRDLFSHFAEAILGLPDQPAPPIRPTNVSPSAIDIEVIRALAVWENAERDGPIPTPVAVAMVARYLRRKPAFETPALTRALAAHKLTLTIDETTAELTALHHQLFAEFGHCLVPPRLPKVFFQPRKAEIPFVHPDYLHAADVQRELAELHRLIRAGTAPATQAGPAAAPAHRPGGADGSAEPPPAATAPAMLLQLLAPAPPPVHVVTFQAGGNSDTFIGDGWSIAEKSGRWSAAQTCELLLPRPAAPGDYVLTIQARPLLVPGRIAAQRLMVEANGTACGEVTLAAPATVRVTLPWDVLGRAEALLLRFHCADAARLADVVPDAKDRRLLGLAFELLSLAGPLPARAPAVARPANATNLVSAARDLMLRFESLGEDCEFGLAQRYCGVEPLGLLRFSSTPLGPLMKALRSRFRGLGEPGSLEIELGRESGEYMVHDTRFGFRYHAWAKAGHAPGDVLDREYRRLPLLVRKLVEDLTKGQKIFVYRGMVSPGAAQVRTLFAALREYGPGRLLWTELADAAHPPGSVIEITPGLLKGHMDRFAPADNVQDLSLDCWLEVCRNGIGTPI